MEAVISLVVLVPLAAGIALLGQYIHIKQMTQAAARAAAWQATVAPSTMMGSMPDGQQVVDNILMRQFGDSQAAIASNSAGPASLADPMLTTFANQELLKPSGVALQTYGQETGPSVFDKAMGLVEHIGRTLPPNPEGLVTAEVHARPELIKGVDGEPLPFMAPLDTLQLDFSAKTVLLVDSWQAAGGGETRAGDPLTSPSNRTVREVIRPLVPSDWAGNSVVGVINGVIGVLGKIPILNDVLTTNWDKLKFGKVAPDAVPEDKLVKYVE